MIGLIAVLAACSAVHAQQDVVPDEPTLIVRVTPSTPYLQEEIVQTISVIAPHPFEELVLDLPPVEGAETITLKPPKTRSFETYGGEGYIYETRRAIFPTRSGELRIPPVRVSGSIGISRKEKIPFTLRDDAQSLIVRPPPETFGGDWWLVARQIDIDERWSKPLDSLRVGDRVTRTIDIAVVGATGAHLPELDQGRSNGLTVLPGRIERRTEITPDGVIGRISRSFDMRVDVDQPIDISPVRVIWWHAGLDIERRTAAPAVRLEPLPRDVEALVSTVMAEAAAARESSRHGILAIALGGGTLAIALAVLSLRSRQTVRPADRRLLRSLSDDDRPIDMVRALEAWALSAFPDERPMNLETLGRRLGPEAQRRLGSLQRAAFGPSAKRDGAADLARDVLTIAQAKRRQTSQGVLAGTLDRLLGPESRLPKIDAKTL